MMLMMLKTKYPQADNVLSALLADVEKNEKDSDVANLAQDDKLEKLVKAVDILQKEINLLKGSKVGEVNQPCRIDKVWVITRVEFLQQAALDEKTKLLLCKEIFEEFLNQSIKEKINKLQIKLKLSD